MNQVELMIFEIVFYTIFYGFSNWDILITVGILIGVYETSNQNFPNFPTSLEDCNLENYQNTL